VNYITPAKPMQLPMLVEQPFTRAVARLAADAGQLRDARQRQPSAYVFRGEVLEEVTGERRYQPGFNLQISPANRRAIESYHRVAYDPILRGQILDGFI
jgi:hypothetical protein